MMAATLAPPGVISVRMPNKHVVTIDPGQRMTCAEVKRIVDPAAQEKGHLYTEMDISVDPHGRRTFHEVSDTDVARVGEFYRYIPVQPLFCIIS